MLLTRPRSEELAPAGVAAAALLFFRLYRPPEEPVLLCAFRWITSWPCPLCGMTRGLCALARGDWVAAVQLNALSPLVLALLIGMLAAAALRLAGVQFRAPWMRRRFWTATAVVFAVYGIVRIASLTL